jgi:hypothetical protein
MATQRYAVNQPPIETLFTWIKEGDIAIPEIQRPFVWDASKVRDFLDSLYRGFPVGFLIAWRNPDAKLKSGDKSAGKRILIDGQQRVTALMAALLGFEVINKDYKKVRIRIGFNPDEERFEVSNPAIEKNSRWIPDIAAIFRPDGLVSTIQEYCDRNPGTTFQQVFTKLNRVAGITSNQIGLIELNSDLDIETVTEIFIRVNSSGVPLSQADFAMSKIAVDEDHGGNMLRKAIDYFCHVAVAPEFFSVIKNDHAFAGSEYFQKMAWLAKVNDDLYDPSYTDMLRVAFTSQFQRGRLEDLVALLSGRNFETRQFEEAIVEESFTKLSAGIHKFINEYHFKQFLMIIRSAGFVSASMIGSQNALNFSYVLYIILRDQGVPHSEIERQVRRWFVFSLLTNRYSGSFETAIEEDVKQFRDTGIDTYAEALFRGTLSNAYWDFVLPGRFETSSTGSGMFKLYAAAQVKLGERGFLSKDIQVTDLITWGSDVHHIFPKHVLKQAGATQSQYNQIANYVICPTEINIRIGNKEPAQYFTEVLAQCNGGPKKYGNITSLDDLRENFRQNAIPEGVEALTIDDYQTFLAQRRALMAAKIRTYFESL